MRPLLLQLLLHMRGAVFFLNGFSFTTAFYFFADEKFPLTLEDYIYIKNRICVLLPRCHIGALDGLLSTSHFRLTDIPSTIGIPKPGRRVIANDGVSVKKRERERLMSLISGLSFKLFYFYLLWRYCMSVTILFP